jgi:hypothetical protein
MTRAPRFIQALLLAALAGGCQTHAATCNGDPAIAKAEAEWKARHLSDYRFVWQQQCFCLVDAVQPMLVTVRHGEIVSATDVKGVAVSDDLRADLLTIDALYERIDQMQCKADEVRFTSSGGGVPLKVFIDPSRQAADEEFEVNVSEFSELAPSP